MRSRRTLVWTKRRVSSKCDPPADSPLIVMGTPVIGPADLEAARIGAERRSCQGHTAVAHKPSTGRGGGPRDNRGASPTTHDQVEVPTIMRALEPEVFHTVWAAIEPLLPVHNETHPLGCHRPRIADRDCFEVMLVRLVTGSSWEDCERLCGNKVSYTTARARRDEWEAAGVFAAIADETIGAYDKHLGLDLREVAVDGSLHKSPRR